MVAVMTPVAPVKGSNRQVVFSFDEFTPASQSPAVRGGKGFHLMEMAALGLPVPPGFTVSTTVARAYRETGALPKRFASQLAWKLRELEKKTGKRFGDPTNPLLLSVRSGAASSMPGMLDTLLNVGLNREIVQTLARSAGEQFAQDTWARFQAQYSQLVSGGTSDVPSDTYTQLSSAINAVMASWTSERAQAYRAAHGLPEWWGTAVNIQAMVFGNFDDQSGTGVVFSHDLTTGRPGICGEFLPRAQGEDVVAGVRTPLPIEEMAKWAPSASSKLTSYVQKLSKHFGDIVDVEFTVEKGELYLLQARRAKRTPRVAVTFAVHEEWAGRISRAEAVASIPESTIEQLTQASFDEAQEVYELREEIARGLSASSGAVVGEVVFSSARATQLANEGRRVILMTRDTSPEDLPGMLASVGLVTQTGGATCHAAVVAREMSLPAVVGASNIVLDVLREGDMISVDGTVGAVYAGELPLITAQLSKEENIFLRWRDRFISRPEINFGSIDGSRMTANELLNDVYLSDALAREAKGTQFAAQAEGLRADVHRRVAGIFAAYLVIAVGGELRHGFTESRRVGAEHELEQLNQKFGLSGFSERSYSQQQAVETLRAGDSSFQCEYFVLAEAVFEKGTWGNSFGGPRWAEIARTVKLYLSGKMTHTVFVDHVFDLRHNGGVLFDKHAMLIRTDEFLLQRQLDTKKSASGLSELHRRLTHFHESVSEPVRTMLEAVAPGIGQRF